MRKTGIIAAVSLLTSIIALSGAVALQHIDQARLILGLVTLVSGFVGVNYSIRFFKHK